MDVTQGYRPLSPAEQAYISEETKNTLGERFRRILNFVIALSCIISFIVLLNFYNTVDIDSLASWYILFNLLMFLTAYINASYKKANNAQRIFASSLGLVISAAPWCAPLYFSNDNIVSQYLMIGILLIIAGGYMQSTIGLFALSAACISLVLMPVALWGLLQGGVFGLTLCAFTIIYGAYLIATNYRSGALLNSALKLKAEKNLYAFFANNDFLTELPNQATLNHYIEEAIKSAKKTNQNFALVCFGINRLEIFNNNMGYMAGDLIISATAKRLQSLLKTLSSRDNINRRLTRPRPDAFVILITPIDMDTIEQEIQQLFLTLKEPFQVQNKESQLTASVGITIFPKASSDSEKLLTNTYAAMFESKLKGGNQITYYKSSIINTKPILLELESELTHAIAKKEFEIYYQPLVDLRSSLICGTEALLRWKHPKRGLIAAADFIPLAEETGLILPMGAWILEEAFTQATLWHRQGFNALKICINLSPKQLRQGDLIKTLDSILKKTEIDPQTVELELTETIMLDDSLSPLIQAISQRGISLVIDNFGTGYSGLRYLKHFKIKKIKIDRSFVTDIIRNDDSATIVSAIIAMAKELGIQTLAEGVETREQLDFLRDKGCQYIQGYYFSKPISASAYQELLERGVAEKL
ncbi:MAG TPA: bifunctional diguanylate cyclase/phosphodiesterase [Gammaproteobacteria bacterium]|nr:bifunctional diguanylate cyclase/phosphodiesterase [Gammaproteobacteria bacterium]